MAKIPIKAFSPDYAIHPGEIVEEHLSARQMKKREFAQRCGISVKTLSQIVNGKAPITSETAIQFERVLGVSASVWNNLQANYQLQKAKLDEWHELEKEKAWVKQFPLKEMINRKWVPKPENPIDAIHKVLNFFGVASVDAWKVWGGELLITAFRLSPSFKSALTSVTAWLRKGELLAEDIKTEPYNLHLFRNNLDKIRDLTCKDPSTFSRKMRQLCSEAGVALIFLNELPKTHLSGATRWLTKNKALIMLSLRHKYEDHFWFSFFHEAAHIVLHGKKQLFIDDIDKSKSSDKEIEADRFSANHLIPEADYNKFCQTATITEKSVLDFSKKLGITPGILVGRLQYDKRIYYSLLNHLKRRLKLVEKYDKIRN